jgi:thiamine biosynthesis lipoprotein
MGTTCRIHLDGPADLLPGATRRLHARERPWSRFRPDSELNRLHRRAGHPTLVGADLLRLLAAARTGWLATDGRFDPSVHDALCANGYDIDLDRRRSIGPAPAPSAGPAPAPGLAGLTLDPASATVVVPAGVRIDPGGIGKGLAADVVARDAVAAGARWAVVDCGGDVALHGDPPSEGWTIAVDGPTPDHPIARVPVGPGGVATSSPCRRRWRTVDGEAHHVIDPATGHPARTAWDSVTVVAATAWWAEVQATAILLGGAAPAHGPGAVAALAVASDGTVHELGAPWRWYR